MKETTTAGDVEGGALLGSDVAGDEAGGGDGFAATVGDAGFAGADAEGGASFGAAEGNAGFGAAEGDAGFGAGEGNDISRHKSISNISNIKKERKRSFLFSLVCSNQDMRELRRFKMPRESKESGGQIHFAITVAGHTTSLSRLAARAAPSRQRQGAQSEA